MAMRSSICSSERHGRRGPPAVLPQVAVDGPVRLARAVVVRGDEGVELAAQLLEPLGHADVAPELADRRRGRLRGAPPRARPTPWPARSSCSLWRRRSSARTWSGSRSPGRPEVVLLLGASPRPPRCRRTTRRRSAGRARPRRTATRTPSPARPARPRCGWRASRRSSSQPSFGRCGSPRTWSRCTSSSLASVEQRRHAGEEHARGLARPPRPDEAADGLREEQRRRGAAWRRRRRPAAGRRRPRTPCGRRRASGSFVRPNSAMRPEAFGSSESTTTGSSPGDARAAARRRPWPWCGRWR